jgi:flagellin
LITGGFTSFEVSPGTFFYGNVANVRFGQGDGSFGAATSYLGAFDSLGDIRLADINGDGHLDLVGATANNQIQISLNDGFGGLSAASSAASGITPQIDFIGVGATPIGGIAIGDFNGDGVLDVTMSGQDYYDGGQTAILLGTTRGGISPLAPFSLKSRADALQALSLFSRGSRNLSEIRGTLGATQSRLNAALGVIVSAKENLTAANSRIIDADVAAESSKLTRTQI